ncbi:MAG: DUF4097 family beta strand repeat-containing protein [Candidatus Zhuqueibacterota bacterium]
MKRILIFAWLMLSLVLVTQSNAQEPIMDRLSVAFSDPSKPGTVEVGLISGSLSVTGYDGKEVIIEATARTKKLEGEENEIKDKAKGMKKIQVLTTGLSVEEENNVLEINVESWRRAIDLTVKVPVKTSLKLSCLNNGDIRVENVEGELEANNINGGVVLKNVSGSVVAHSLNKDVVVLFNRVDPSKTMSFSSMNGDIDVTFPSNFKANAKLKSNQGEIYSDFDLSQQEVVKDFLKEDKRSEGGKYRISFESGILVKINGGGPEILFNSFNGDIFIRKAN